jgi:hypothetical protein
MVGAACVFSLRVSGLYTIESGPTLCNVSGNIRLMDLEIMS